MITYIYWVLSIYQSLWYMYNELAHSTFRIIIWSVNYHYPSTFCKWGKVRLIEVNLLKFLQLISAEIGNIQFCLTHSYARFPPKLSESKWCYFISYIAFWTKFEWDTIGVFTYVTCYKRWFFYLVVKSSFFLKIQNMVPSSCLWRIINTSISNYS